jgi:hypothetical protein
MKRKVDDSLGQLNCKRASQGSLSALGFAPGGSKNLGDCCASETPGGVQTTAKHSLMRRPFLSSFETHLSLFLIPCAGRPIAPRLQPLSTLRIIAFARGPCLFAGAVFVPKICQACKGNAESALRDLDNESTCRAGKPAATVPKCKCQEGWDTTVH